MNQPPMLVEEPPKIEPSDGLVYISYVSGDYQLPVIVMRRSTFFEATRVMMSMVKALGGEGGR